MIGRRAVLLGLPLVAAGCSAPSVWAPETDVAAVRYRHPGPPQLTLMTCLNNDSRGGAHTGLIINASERVIFDPAGSFAHAGMVERNDVIFGATDSVVDQYIAFQSTEAYHAILLTRDVTPEVAEMALAAAKVAGPVGKSQCTVATSRLLAGLPGFDGIRSTWFPDNLMRQFAGLSGVTPEFVYRDNDEWRDAAIADYERDVLARIAA